MATKVVMEALSPTMEEGRLVKWLKSEGDTVKNGDVLAEVETDKAVMELVARGDGVLRKQLAAEGDSSPVGTLLAVIAGADENIDQLTGGAAPAPPKPADASAAPAPAKQANVSAASAAPAKPADASATPARRAPAGGGQQNGGPAAQPQQATSSDGGRAGDGGRLRSSPLARRLASERGVSLDRVSGSGPGGRIITRDIEAAGAAGAAGARAPQASLAAPRAEGEFRDIPLTQIRKTIARRLSESIGPIPTFYLTAEYDLERISELRGAMAELGDEYKVSFNDIIMKAVATALVEHPECNAHWLGDRIREFNRVHLGMAVATDEGLIVPVIFDADAKSLREIAAEARELAKRARERKLKPEEYTGSTFSVSNLGMFGIDQFTAIINPPEAGILAIGAVEKKQVVVKGEVVIRSRLRITMSCDHRVIDGAIGARFLQTLRRMLENPLMLIY
jgi:pyruvate dehydrogenase E2 component (dihydrolipoamide acetyltransferase)